MMGDAEMPTQTNSLGLVLIWTFNTWKISTNTNLGGQCLPYIYSQILTFSSWLQNTIFIHLNTNFGQVRLASLEMDGVHIFVHIRVHKGHIHDIHTCMRMVCV